MPETLLVYPCSSESRIMRPGRLIFESGHPHPLRVTREHEAQRALDPVDGRLGACLTNFGIERVRSWCLLLSWAQISHQAENHSP